MRRILGPHPEEDFEFRMLKRRRPIGFTQSSRPFKRPRQTTQAAAIGRLQRRRVLQPRIGGFTGIEKKFVDYNISNTALTTTWAGGELDPTTPLAISAIAQGDGESQRDGRVATLHSVFIKGFFVTAVVESSIFPLSDVIVRLVLVQDKQTNGAQLNAEDVFDTIAATADVNSVKNLQNSARFIVLKDKTFMIPRARANTNEGASNLFATGQVLVPFKMGFNFRKPIRVNHTGTTAVVTSIADNSLHLIGTTTNGASLLTYRTRVRFTG